MSGFIQRDEQKIIENLGIDLSTKRKEKAIRLIMESIKETLRPIPENLGKRYGYWDIVRCARANLYTGDDTSDLVDEALRRLRLTEEFPKV